MVQNAIIAFFLVILSGISALIFGQATDPMKPKMIPGEVVTVGAASLRVKTATGEVDATITDKTEFKKAEAGNIKNLVASTLSEIAAGDRVIVSGFPAADGKSVPAIRVYLMSKAALDQAKAKEADEWRTRGVTGKVTAVNAAANQVTIQVRGAMGAPTTSVALTAKPDAKYLRYASDSVNFSDAKASSLSEIQTGDELRAIGDKSTDGLTFTAETVLTGGFRQVAGKIKSVDVATKELLLDDGSKAGITVSFAKVVLMKRFPAEMADRMAMMQMGGGAGMARPPGQAGAPAGQSTPPNGQATPPNGQAGGPRPGGMGGARGGDIIERQPDMTPEELKVGDTIGILISGGPAGTLKVSAIKLIAGVEPFLRMAAAAGAAGGRGQNNLNINIPGLDGIGF